MSQLPYNFIAIEGNIGAGKTTLCRMLERDFNVDLILEQFTDNPFLPQFYKDPKRYGFPVELFFMTERYKQLSTHFSRPDLFKPQTVADYFFIKTLLFAGRNLEEDEYRLFYKLFSILNKEFPDPDIIFYLHRPVDVLLRQIQLRSRRMETGITAEYLTGIQDAYMNYFRSVDSFPVVILELGDRDFVRHAADYRLVLDQLSRTYRPGLTHVSLRVEQNRE